MSEQLLNIIIKAVISLVVALITTFIIPAIAKWIGNLNNAKLKAFIKSAVRAAEQIYGGGTAEIKKQYVIDHIKEKFKKLKISSDELDTYIEDAVYEVSGAIKGAVKQIKEDLDAQGVEASKTLSNGLTIIQESKKKVKDAESSTSIMKIS